MKFGIIQVGVVIDNQSNASIKRKLFRKDPISIV